ncbi:MAG: hypothetical protein Q8L79_02335 [Methylobacter sp.]|uniref:hypothetical protein n=1 Tax=Methylobacter sp. TaxID=2051955 RepID=UPI0027303CA1|nr:hypothetical protein [Methylobacter sp.]MDP1663935.1 hypothetical protein [Methylobacter sp.]MDP1971183.1 hypothetical protein [Methylobacter sp.]
MIIRISLLLMLASLPVFLLVELLLWLAIPGLPSAIIMLGTAMLLSAFAVLIIAGLLGIFKIIARTVLDYFSAKQRAQRRLWFVQARQDQVKRLFYFKAMQIRYFNELNRKRLLTLNNRKHIQSLSRSIDKDLLSIKTKLPEIAYLQLQQDNARYRNRQDIEALLTLQQKISTIV